LFKVSVFICRPWQGAASVVVVVVVVVVVIA
jgi:hypothetical protein